MASVPVSLCHRPPALGRHKKYMHEIVASLFLPIAAVLLTGAAIVAVLDRWQQQRNSQAFSAWVAEENGQGRGRRLWQ